MKHLILTSLLLITFLSSSSLNAQQISSANYNEEFNQEGKYFKIETTTDNDFVLDKGDYLLSRNNKESEYAIIANNSSVSNFILKYFESSGVKPSDLIKRTNASSTPKDLEGNSTIYAVQFGVFMQVQAYSTLKVLDEVWYETTKYGTYVYLSGQFKNSQEATVHKIKCQL